jgi:hypothetical protein
VLPVGVLFTRPPIEAFTNPLDMVSEVSPPQAEPTPLNIFVSQARRGPAPGEKAEPDADPAEQDKKEKKEKKEKKASKKEKKADAKGNTEVSHLHRNALHLMWAEGDATVRDQGNIAWRGDERVLMSLLEGAGGHFVAKPSLNERHVLAVTTRHITTYLIAIAAPSVGRPAVTETPRRALAALPPAVADSVVNSLSASSVAPGADSKDDSALSVDEAADRARRLVLLKQMLVQADNADDDVGADSALSTTHFRLPHPDRRKVRAHYFGTVGIVSGVQHDELFLRLSFVFASGCTTDVDGNRASGVVCPAAPLTSQTAFAARMLDQSDDGHAHVTQHCFNFPFEQHVVLPEHHVSPPRLVIEVWSAQGHWQAFEGYGLVTLPPAPGARSMSSGLWRPSMQGRETAKTAYFGGSSSLVDVTDAAIPYEKRADGVELPSVTCASRAGLQSESTGAVSVEWMCITQQKPYVSKEAASRYS